jgi:hypothetical protein
MEPNLQSLAFTLLEGIVDKVFEKFSNTNYEKNEKKSSL